MQPTEKEYIIKLQKDKRKHLGEETNTLKSKLAVFEDAVGKSKRK